MGKQMMNHVIDAKIRESKRTVIVVQFQGAETRGIGLETEDEDIGHEAHVLGNVLRNAIGGTRDVGLGQGRTPALQFSLFAGLVDALFDVAH